MAGKPRDASTQETIGEKTPSTTDAEDRRNRETEDRDVHEGRKKTSQVEHLTVIPTESDSFDRKNHTDSLMFGRNRFRVDDKTKKFICLEEEKAKIVDYLPHKAGKMRMEMRTTEERTTASCTLLSTLQCHARSPGVGKMMKQGRGTPTKKKNVQKLRKIFENENSVSSQTMGCTELLLQSSAANPLINLQATVHPRLKPKICVDQSSGGTQTGPRDRVGLEMQPSCDWTRLSMQGAGGPTRVEVPGTRLGRGKK